MGKRYNLYGFIIVENERGLEWIQHMGDMNDMGEMMCIAGSAYVLKEYDVLLPKWDKTKFYVKLADIELYSLIECKTGAVVYSEKNPDILRSLRLIENKRNIGDL